MGGAVFALIEGATYGWWRQPSGAPSPVPAVAAAAALSTVVFFVREGRARSAGRPAMIDVGLLRLPTLRYGLIAAAVVAFGEFGLMFTLPLLLQGALGYSALGAGWLLVSLAIGAFLVSGATPHLTQAIGQRSVVRIGLALEAVAVAGIALTLSLTIASWAIAAWLFVYGVGVGMATAQLSSVIMSDVPPAQGGQASGLQSTVRQLGSALGIAVLGTLLVTSLGAGLQERLDASGMPPAASVQVVEIVRGSAGAAIPSLAADPQGAGAAYLARAAMVDASRRTAGFAAAALALGVLATLALPTPRRPDDDPHL
jgi:predicted MFS family arabinose efflux permease